MNAALDLRGQVLDGLTQEAYRLSRQGDLEEALSCINRGFAVAPQSAHLFNTRSMILDALRRHDEALENVQRALAVDPEFPDAINNRGIHYARLGNFESALTCYERVLALNPGHVQARYNRAMAFLALGRWLRGFREFEIRWQLFPVDPGRPKYAKPVWMGERDIAGRTILLRHEQGFGDSLQFCRYVPLVMRLGARVIVAVPAALRSIMETLPGQPQIVTEGDPAPEHDYYCSLMTLAHVFCATPENVPREIPYLRAARADIGRWAERLGQKNRPRIGLTWSGRRYPPINHVRDMTLDLLAPLLEAEADFVCLQADLTESERGKLAAIHSVARYGDEFADFADTAGLIEHLDLVITVDTAVAHLAGALGKPVWLMNRRSSCWRWLQGRGDTPWYPRMRIFRQPACEDWPSVVRAVAEALGEFIADNAPLTGPAPGDAKALLELLNTGLAEYHQGRIVQAIEAYRRVLAAAPRQPEALRFLGVALAQRGEYVAALKRLSAALEVQPESAPIYNDLGNVLAALKRPGEALASYDRSVSIDPGFAEAHYNRGVTLGALGRTDESIESYLRAIALKPDHCGAHNNLGSVYIESRRYEEALACFDTALQLRPDFDSAAVNRANTLGRLYRSEEAAAAARAILARTPGHSEAHSALGSALAAQGHVEEALACYRQALELKPDLAEALWNRSLAHLSQGEFRDGWLSYETRWKVRGLKLQQRYPERSPWLGKESLRGKTILLHAEQGYGDSIQFCRYAPLLAAEGARVLLGVPSGLTRLMSSLEGVAQVVAQSPIPAFDHHCPLLSLPLALQTQLETIPAEVPYLRASPHDQSVWAARLGARTLPRIGLVWSGSSTHANDANRSIALQELLPLVRSEVQWVSLQKEIRASDATLLSGLERMHRAGEDLKDFADTAALLAELDLVITVDTSVAHLAGALGKPVWILLPHVADWRWLRGREDSPWYPSARLFRQPARKDWASVIERVTHALRAFPR